MNNEELIIDGSHYEGILKAIGHVLYSGYKATDTEIVCNGETEEYVLQLLDERHTVITTIPY